MAQKHLKLVVLKSLLDKPLSGYGLMKRIEEVSGWKPSPGSMYPLLDSLLKEGCLTVKKDGRKKNYFITSKGKEYFNELNQKKDELIDNLASNVRTFDSVFECGIGVFADLLNKLKQGKHEKDIKRILKNTTNELSRLK